MSKAKSVFLAKLCQEKYLGWDKRKNEEILPAVPLTMCSNATFDIHEKIQLLLKPPFTLLLIPLCHHYKNYFDEALTVPFQNQNYSSHRWFAEVNKGLWTLHRYHFLTTQTGQLYKGSLLICGGN